MAKWNLMAISYHVQDARICGQLILPTIQKMTIQKECAATQPRFFLGLLNLLSVT